MKSLFKNLIVFAMLTLAVSSFNGCGGGQPANNATANTNASNANSASMANATEYPPLASALADAEFENLDGTKFKTSDKKGEVVLLNIWGIWCGPCRAEMPELIALQDKYRSQGLEIVGLNIGDEDGGLEPMDAIKKFADAMKLNYTIARSPRESTQQYYAVTKKSVVPQNILIDRKGRLRGVFSGAGSSVYQALRDTIDKVVNEQ
ncbi:MAG TPA: TlpA disulfide reductase family protein [Pyrinomonadaceae bacterium]|nr:TlpA disulfide reductase family protein [Pyrinomonadaceae bacterium]